MEKTVAIVQSCYIPWKGYHDLVALVDEFILYDDRQYTKNDWRNRNRIKTPDGLRWLTIPVTQSGRFGQRIDETFAANDAWRSKHWKTIVQNYRKAPYFDLYSPTLERAYLDNSERRLSEINHQFLTLSCALLGITTPISWSRDYEVSGERSTRVLALCLEAGATEYLSGPSARAYIDEGAFEAAGVRVTYMDYSGYPEYTQPHPPFDHAVSVLDLLLSVGPTAPMFMKFGMGAGA